MSDYPREGVALLYLLLCASQIYLAILWAVGKFRPLGVVWSTLTYVVLGLAFGLTTLGTLNPPVIDLVEQRWLLRACYTSYLVLSLYAILSHWFGLFSQALRRAAEDARRADELRMSLAEDRRRLAEDARSEARQPHDKPDGPPA